MLNDYEAINYDCLYPIYGYGYPKFWYFSQWILSPYWAKEPTIISDSKYRFKKEIKLIQLHKFERSIEYDSSITNYGYLSYTEYHFNNDGIYNVEYEKYINHSFKYERRFSLDWCSDANSHLPKYEYNYFIKNDLIILDTRSNAIVYESEKKICIGLQSEYDFILYCLGDHPYHYSVNKLDLRNHKEITIYDPIDTFTYGFLSADLKNLFSINIDCSQKIDLKKFKIIHEINKPETYGDINLLIPYIDYCGYSNDKKNKRIEYEERLIFIQSLVNIRYIIMVLVRVSFDF